LICGYDGSIAKELFNPRAAIPSAEGIDPSDRGNQIINAVCDKAGHTLINDFGHRAASKPDYGCTAGHRLGHYNAKGLLPQDRHQKSPCAAEKHILGFIV